jgi:hypothetical protein
MSESNDNHEGLAALLADALIEEEVVEADLLLRYASEAESLEPAERDRVERYLAASPAHRQQLRSLVRFAEARAGLIRDGGPEQPSEAEDGAVVAISSHPRWRARATLIGGALAAGLAAVLLYGPLKGVGPDDRSDVQMAEEPSSARDSHRAPVPVAPQPERPLDPSARALETRLAQDAPAEEGRIEAPDPGSHAESAAAPEPVLAQASPAEAARPEPRADVVLPPEPESERELAPEEEPREIVLLAMHVAGPLRYAEPADAISLPSLAGLRSEQAALTPARALSPALQALAPAHVARTLGESPSLYWFLSEATDRPLEFVLSDRVSIDPVLVLDLAPPHDAGIHSLDLAAHDVVLEPGKEYRWFVSMAVDEGAAAEDLVSRGGVLRVEPGAELSASLAEASPGEQGRIYADQGFWYDALAFISESIDRDPEDERLRELRAGLLEGGGLAGAAEYDRRASGHETP